MFEIIFALVAVLVLFLWIRSMKPVNFPPGPTPLPVIGNMHNLVGGSNILEVIRKLRKQYGDIFCLSLGKNWTVVVNGRTNMKELFVKKGEITSDRPDSIIMKFLKGKGIVSASGATWKHNRTYAMTKLRGFGFGRGSFEASVMEEVNEFVRYVHDKAGNPFQLTEILNTSVANALMGILTGKRFEYTDEEIRHYVHITTTVASNPTLTGPVNFIPWLAKLPFDPFGVDKLLKLFEEIFAYWRRVIQEHKEALDEKNLDNFIDIYLQEMTQAENSNSDQFAEDQLLCIIIDTFIAGTETSSTVIKWFIVYMINHPEVQEKMQAEISKTVGNGRPPSLSDKSNLPYCEAVMYETLRLSNVGPLALPHLVTGDIEHNGYLIPNGCVLMPCLDSVSIDEETFPDCYSFKPDRFLNEDGKFNITNDNNILTFSLGRRVCMGEALAKMELFLYMTSLVQRFTFHPPENEPIPSMEPVFAFVQKPKPFSVRALSKY